MFALSFIMSAGVAKIRRDRDSQTQVMTHTKNGSQSKMLRYYSIHTVTYKKTEWHNLVHLIRVCEHVCVCAQVCVFWSWGGGVNTVRSPWGLRTVTHVMDWTVHNATTSVYTPIDVNAVLVGFIFDFISLFSSKFCVCEDANVTHKVSIVKKKKKKIHCWVCLRNCFGICC